VIVGTDIEVAEARLKASKAIAGLVSPTVLCERARVNPDALDNFIRANSELMHKRIPNLDPRIDPTFNTMFRHAFLVGIMCGREDTQRTGEGAGGA
jgi:hypothetical protein